MYGCEPRACARAALSQPPLRGGRPGAAHARALPGTPQLHLYLGNAPSCRCSCRVPCHPGSRDPFHGWRPRHSSTQTCRDQPFPLTHTSHEQAHPRSRLPLGAHGATVQPLPCSACACCVHGDQEKVAQEDEAGSTRTRRGLVPAGAVLLLEAQDGLAVVDGVVDGRRVVGDGGQRVVLRSARSGSAHA